VGARGAAPLLGRRGDRGAVGLGVVLGLGQQAAGRAVRAAPAAHPDGAGGGGAVARPGAVQSAGHRQLA
jgi:hypothetical protein